MAVKTFTPVGGLLKFKEVGVVLKYYNLNKLQINIKGNFIAFPDGNKYLYNDAELTNTFASVEAFADQVGEWKKDAQSRGGASGISNPAFCVLNVADGTQTSAGTWYCSKQMATSDMTIREFEIGFSSVGADLVTIGVWSEDRSTLIDSTNATVTLLQTEITPITGATLVGGTYYWIGAKCSAGISDFFKNTAFSDSKVSISFFNTGTPSSIPATAGTVAPKICLKG